MAGVLILSCKAPANKAPVKLAPEQLLQEEIHEFEAGDLPAAYRSATQGYESTQPAEPMHEVFSVQLARVHLYQGSWDKALDLLAAPLPAGVDRGLAVQHQALLASVLVSLHRLPEAREVLEAANKKFGRETPDPDLEASWGKLERAGLDTMPAAVQHYRHALEGAVKRRDVFLQMTTSVNLGLVETELQRFDAAIDYLKQGQPLAEQLGNRVALEKLEGNLGRVQIHLGDLAQAEKNLQAAREMAHNVGQQEDELTWAIDEAKARSLRGDAEGSKQLYQWSLDQALSRNHSHEAALAHGGLAELLLRESNPAASAPHLAAAAKIYLTEGNEKQLLWIRFLQSRSEALYGDANLAASELLSTERDPKTPPSLRWEVEEELALLAQRRKDDHDAHAWFYRATQTFQTQQCTVSDLSSKLPFGANGTELYQAYVEHLIAEGKTDEALLLYDQGRASTLRNCKEGAAKVSVKQSSLSAAGLRKLAASLHGTILIYYLLPETSYLWAVSPERIGFYRLPGESEITHLVDHHQALMESIKGDPIQTGDTAARSLYDKLISPAQAQIKPKGAVYILADRGLSKLNFDTLLTPGDRPHFWIEDVTVVNASSLRLLAQVQPPRLPTHQQSDQVLVVGNPTYPPNVPALLYANEEVQKVAGHFAPGRTTLFTGASATPSAFMRQDLTRYANIHVVAHAEANGLRPLDSFLLLAGNNKLYAYDIATRPLKADLVTLSVCDASGENSFEGEGLVGLAWAFMRAGARSVIGTLSKVPDQTAPEFMDHLYANLAQGMPPERALREAKLAALHSNSYRKPFYWAQYQLYSNSPELRN